MIAVRTIGYQENAPKTNSIGSRNTSVDNPPPLTQVSGVRRTRYCVAAASRRWAVGVTDSIAAMLAVSRRLLLGGRLPGHPGRTLASLLDRVLRDVVRLLQQLQDVGVLVRQHGLDGGVERVVDALRRRGRLRNQLLVEDVRQERLHLRLRNVD